jgi:glycosyltransferase involved in cell wall biosynthesis
MMVMRPKYKKLILLLPWTEYLDVHLKKDTGLFPVYFAKTYNIPVEIVFFESPLSTQITSHRGVAIRRLESVKGITNPPGLFKQPVKFLKFLLRLFRFLKKENSAISHIMLFHLTSYTAFLCTYVKMWYPHIKIYIKLDINEFGVRRLVERGNLFQNIIWYNLIPHIDLISAETKNVVSALHKNPRFSKIEYVPNGFDDELISYSADSLPRCNTIITVGRLFSAPKNTELLLEILSILDLKGWRVKLIGPIETNERDGFSIRADFFLKHQHLRNAVEFTGNISGVAQLAHILGESKIFLFTSRFESFGIALLEAAAAGDYVITTDVGCGRDLTRDGKFGFVCPESRTGFQNEAVIKQTIANHLQSIIDGKIDIDGNRMMQKEYVFKNYAMSEVVKSPCFRNFFAE